MFKLRHLFKKGRIVTTRQSKIVINLANKIVSEIKPYCRRIQIFGSLRRKEKNPVDIDVVLIPKNEENKKKIEEILSRKGKFLEGGEQRASFRIKRVKVELYYTTPEEEGAALLAYSSRFGASIGLRLVAKRKGFKLNQHGLFKNNKRIVGRTEKEIYSALGRPWKSPEKR
jgi:DNA polymerase (family 10)